MYRPIIADSLTSIWKILGMPDGIPQKTLDYKEDFSVEPEVRQTLQALAEHLKPNSYLEVGAHRGDTFFSIAYMLPSSSRAYAIEPNPLLSDLISFQLPLDHNHCKATLIRKTSRAAFESWGREGLDMVFIDGDHTYCETLFDIAAWSTVLNPHGIMIIHDTVTRLERRFPEDYIPNPWDYDIIDVVGLQRRTSSHAWEGVAFLRWKPEIQNSVRARLLRDVTP